MFLSDKCRRRYVDENGDNHLSYPSTPPVRSSFWPTLTSHLLIGTFLGYSSTSLYPLFSGAVYVAR